MSNISLHSHKVTTNASEYTQLWLAKTIKIQRTFCGFLKKTLLTNNTHLQRYTFQNLRHQIQVKPPMMMLSAFRILNYPCIIRLCTLRNCIYGKLSSFDRKPIDLPHTSLKGLEEIGRRSNKIHQGANRAPVISAETSSSVGEESQITLELFHGKRQFGLKLNLMLERLLEGNNY